MKIRCVSFVRSSSTQASGRLVVDQDPASDTDRVSYSYKEEDSERPYSYLTAHCNQAG